MSDHTTGTREQWREARLALLEREKELTRRNDELARERRALPWVPLEEEHAFDTEDGRRTLADLFDGCSQLMVYHFMFGPGEDVGCPSCSSLADTFDAVRPHLRAKDVNLVAVSRGPLDRLLAYRSRMGWSFPWASSAPGRFNFAFHVSFEPGQPEPREYNFAPVSDGLQGEAPGTSAFALRDGVVHHTYSSYARGGDALWAMYPWLDRAPRGRDEDGGPVWVRRHDEYDGAAAPPCH